MVLGRLDVNSCIDSFCRILQISFDPKKDRRSRHMVMRGYASVVGNHLGGMTASWAQVHNNQIVVGTKAGPLCKIVVEMMPMVYLNIILIYFSIGKLLLLC